MELFAINFCFENIAHPSESIDLFKTSVNENKFKDLINLYNEENNFEQKEIRYLIIEYLSKFNGNKTVIKQLLGIFSNIEINDFTLQAIKDIGSDTAKNACCNVKQLNHLHQFLFTAKHLLTKYEFCINSMFSLNVLIIHGFISKAENAFDSIQNKEELFMLLNNTLKQILYGLVKVEIFLDLYKSHTGSLIKMYYDILKNSHITFDIKSKCGMLLIHSILIMPKEELEYFVNKDFPIIELIKNNNEDIWFKLKCYTFENILTDDAIKIIIYSSIFNILSEARILEIKIKDTFLAVFLYDELICCGKRVTGHPQQIVEVSRTLSMIGKHLKFLPIEIMEHLFIEGCEFVWSHIDHFVDTVRNYSKSFLADLTNVGYIHFKNGYNDCVNILLKNIHSSRGTSTVRFIAIECIADSFGSSFVLTHFPNVRNDFLNLLSEVTISDLICKTYNTVMEIHFKEVVDELWINNWVDPVLKLIKCDTQSKIYYQKIITKAFQINPKLLRKIFPVGQVFTAQENAVVLNCLKVARKYGIIIPTDTIEDNLYWRKLILKSQLENFKFHQDEEIRIAVLAVIVESQKSTEQFLEWEFDFLLSFLEYNITSQIPNIRKQILTFYKNVLTRYNASYNVVLRTLKKNNSNEEFKYIERFYKKFLIKLTKFLISNIIKNANYPRRSTSLELLILINPLLNKEEWNKCWNKKDVMNCQSILYDSYESNKKMALQILLQIPTTLIGFDDINFSNTYIKNCVNMAMDIKPSKTLSAAYMFQLCFKSPHSYEIIKEYHRDNKSEQKNINDKAAKMSIEGIKNSHYLLLTLLVDILEKGNKDIDLANLKTSHYGILLSMRYLLESRNLSENIEQYPYLFEKIVTLCLKIKNHIMPIVCNQSPEGYLPENPENEFEIDESATAQMVLVYSWRTMKEMTLLLAEIVNQTIKFENILNLLSEKDLIDIGQLFINIFIESKHRGVFEQAYVGFSVVCNSFWSSANVNINNLPKYWLEEALNLCTGKKKSNNLCATRRSAGLPFLILSILITDPDHNKSSFHSTMKNLIKCCELTNDSTVESRMHCLNVLRALFRHSKLGELVSPYVGETIIHAIRGFKSPTWSIRNSATLLYSSLMTRIFGVQRTQDSEELSMKNRLTVRVFFMRYPELLKFLLNTLSEECEKADSLILHPILMILARLYPSHIVEYNSQMEKYVPLVNKCLSNSVCRTRELAARASMSLIAQETVLEHLKQCFANITLHTKNNECHGNLLQVWRLIKSNNIGDDFPLEEYLKSSMVIIEKSGVAFSHLTVSLYLDILTNLFLRHNGQIDILILKRILTLLNQLKTSFSIIANNKLKETTFKLTLVLLLLKVEITQESLMILRTKVMEHLHGLCCNVNKMCLYFFIYLNESYYENQQKHILFETDSIALPEDIETIVNKLNNDNKLKILSTVHLNMVNFIFKKIKEKHHNDEDFILILILLNYYPCIFEKFYDSAQNILEFFCNLIINNKNEELISAVIYSIGVFLSKVNINSLKSMHFKNLISILMESASPAAMDCRRLAVCDFFTRMTVLYNNQLSSFLQGNDLINVLNIIMVLLEDDDLYIRNSMSNFVLNSEKEDAFIPIVHSPQPVIPEKAREYLLDLSTKILSQNEAVNFLFSWSCRYFPDFSNDTSEIFERGELNLFAENIFVVEKSIYLLRCILWKKKNTNEEPLTISELNTTTSELKTSMTNYPSLMMSNRSKRRVISVLNLIQAYLKKDNCESTFLNYFNEIVIQHLAKYELFDIAYLMKKIYFPSL